MAYIGDSQGAAEIDPNAFIKWLSRDDSEGGNRTGKRWPCCHAVQVLQKSAAVISFDTMIQNVCTHCLQNVYMFRYYVYHCLPRFHHLASTQPVLSRNQRLGRSSVTDHFWWRSLYGDTDLPNRVSVRRVLNIRIGVHGHEMKRWVLCIKAMQSDAMCFCTFSQLAGPAAGHGTCRFRGVALHLLQLLDPKGWLTGPGALLERKNMEKYGKIDKDNDALSKQHFVGVRGNRYLLDRSNRMKVGESHEQRPCRSEANSSPVETVGRWPAIGYGPVGVHRSDQMPWKGDDKTCTGYWRHGSEYRLPSST